MHLTNVQSGVNGFLDIARLTYKEANADAYQHVTGLGGEFIRPLRYHGLMQQKKSIV